MKKMHIYLSHVLRKVILFIESEDAKSLSPHMPAFMNKFRSSLHIRKC